MFHYIHYVTLNHWSLLIELKLHSSRTQGWSWKFPLSNHRFGSSGNQLPSWAYLGASKSHLININTGTVGRGFFLIIIKLFLSTLSGNFRKFRNSDPRMGQRSIYLFPTIIHIHIWLMKKPSNRFFVLEKTVSIMHVISVYILLLLFKVNG